MIRVSASPYGWHRVVSGEYVAPSGVIGIVVAQKFPDPKTIRLRIEEGIERVSPDTVWVMRDSERKGHAANYAWATFRAHGIEPFLAPLVPAWKGDGLPLLGPLAEGVRKHDRIYDYDLRADWRDIEIRATCERVVVFHDKSSNVTDKWLTYRDNGMSAAKIFVVERGKVKAKRYKTGRPVS